MLQLKVYDGQEKVTELTLGTEIVTLGRDPSSTIRLSDVSVSRRHAQIEPHGNFYLIRDNGSTNGTFVNEMLVRMQLVGHGDAVRVGRYILRVESRTRAREGSTRVRVDPLYIPGQSAGQPGGASQATTAFRSEGSATRDPSAARILDLSEIQTDLARLDTTQQVLSLALDRILAALRGERGTILLQDRAAPGRSRPRLVPAVVVGGKGADEANDQKMVVPEALAQQVIEKGRGIRWTASGGPYNRHALIAPLHEGSSVVGVVYLERPARGGPFSPEDQQLLGALANAASVSYANARLLAESSAERGKLLAVFASLTDGILVTDNALRVVDANRTAMVLLGLQNRNPLGCDLIELFDGFSLKPAPGILRELALSQGAILHLTANSDADSTPTYSHLAGRILPYPAGSQQPHGAVAWLRDESSLRQLEALKTQFLANLAHKLRSPLTVVQASLPLLRDNPVDAQEMLDVMERNTRVLCNLVGQFTDYAELEAQAAAESVLPEPLQLHQLLQETVKLSQPAALAKSIEVKSRVPEDLPPVRARHHHMVKAFGYLLDNAIKFAGREGHVSIEAEPQGGSVQIDIIDDGPGIPAVQQESVFLVGHQVDEERTGEVPGAGLGLPMARHLVQEHGGEISISSPYRFPDHGTRVSVILPTTAVERRDVAANVEGALA